MTFSVLIVEDDLSSSDILTQILEYHDMHVTVAASAEDALELLRSHQYDIAILDLALPNMDGWQLHREMQKMPNAQETIVVALTAYHTPLLAKEAKDNGFAAAFAKPVTASFVTSLQKLLH